MSDTTYEWKDIPSYEGLYQINSSGDIRATRRQGSQGGVRPHHTDKKGYKRITLTKDGKGKNFLVHHLVAAAFLGNRPDNMFVCHKDGDCANNNVNNLYYGTRSDNSKDSVKHGTHNFLKQNFTGEAVKGEDCTWSKLTEDSVKYIKRMKGYKSCSALAKELNVTRSNISAIWTGRSWRHIV